MLLNTPHVLSSIPRLLVIPLFLLFSGLFLLPRQQDGPSLLALHGVTATQAASTFNATVHHFWQNLAAALLDAQPQCGPLSIVDEDDGPSPFYVSSPFSQRKQPVDRLLGFTSLHEEALFRAHASMRAAANHLAPSLPFAAGTTGIVTTANAKYMPIFLVSLRMLRRTGNKMPVEVFIDDWSEYEPIICDIVLPSLNARCVVLSNVYGSARNLARPDHYQYKILAILFSSFQHVLFLDSDAFPAYDPTALFKTTPYTTHGLITWPDYWALTVSPHFYRIATVPEEVHQGRLSSESGQLMMNKEIHRESLLMMVYYNYYGPDYYYILLSQGAPGAGDKETFVQAALATGLPYYQVKTPPSALGRVVNGSYRGIAIAQANPALDFTYQAYVAKLMNPDTLSTNTNTNSNSNSNTPPISDPPAPPQPPQPVFLHQNTLKLDPQSLLHDKSQPTFEPDGAPHRMWGSQQEMEIMLGYDVEKRLWDVLVEEGCRGQQKIGHTCAELRVFQTMVFAQ